MNDTPLPSSIFRLSRKGQEIGQYDSESIQSMLEAGILDGTEYCWQAGFKGWTPISSIFRSADRSQPTSTDPTAPAEGSLEPSNDETPPGGAKLLSPTAIANLSLLFGPFWGAFFVSRNWEAVGDSAAARRSMLWLTIGLPVSIAIWFATGIPVTFPWIISGILGLLTTLLWYYLDAKKQMDRFKSEGIAQFEESWIMPTCLGLAIVSGILFLGLAWSNRG
jgi:hypothetical protein